MSTADVITLAFFLLVILLGLAVLLALDVLRRRPRHQIRQRLESIRDRSGGSKNNQAVARDLSRARTESHRRRRRESLGSLGYYLNRLDTVTGSHGVRNFFVGLAGNGAGWCGPGHVRGLARRPVGGRDGCFRDAIAGWYLVISVFIKPFQQEVSYSDARSNGYDCPIQSGWDTNYSGLASGGSAV